MEKRRIAVYLFLTFLIMGASLFLMESVSEAAKLRISYSGKKRNYKGKKISTFVNNKSVSKGTPKGLTINKTNMISYKDVFKKGCKAVCTYHTATKKITVKHNGVTLKMRVGKKTATVNGVKKKMPKAPLKVKYIKTKKSRILVPAKFVSKQLKYTYLWTNTKSRIDLTAPFKINDAGKDVYYTGYKGNLKYNNRDYKLSTMPALSIEGMTFVPAEEVFAVRMGLTYTYHAQTGNISIQDPETGKNIRFTAGSKSAVVDGKSKSLKAAPRLIKRYDTNKTVLCVPANFTAANLGYYYKWDKAGAVSFIHKKSYFHWNQPLGLWNPDKKDEEPPKSPNPQQTSPPSVSSLPGQTSLPSISPEPSIVYENAISSIDADYDPKLDGILFKIKGVSSDIMKKVVPDRKDGVLNVVFPNTVYDLEETEYTKFGDVLSGLTVEQKGTETVIAMQSAIKGDTLDFAYTVADNVLSLYVMSEYVGRYSLKISRPSGVDISKVTNNDIYTSNKFTITIKGNHVEYFKKNPVAIGNNVITSVGIKLNASKNTVITVATSKLQGYKIYQKPKFFVVEVDAPRKIYDKIVVLDAGHGGTDPGAVANGKKEKNLNLKMMVTLMKPYFKSNAPDIKVYWTRSTDTFITLSNRAAFAKKVGADIFVSLHMNAWTKKNVNGTEVYYSGSNNKSSFSGLTSKKMASLFLKRLVSAMGTKSRGVSSQKYTVVHKNTVPAVLIELGFLTGSSDIKKLKNAEYQKKATKTIFNTVQEVFSSYKTNR